MTADKATKVVLLSIRNISPKKDWPVLFTRVKVSISLVRTTKETVTCGSGIHHHSGEMALDGGIGNYFTWDEYPLPKRIVRSLTKVLKFDSYMYVIKWLYNINKRTFSVISKATARIGFMLDYSKMINEAECSLSGADRSNRSVRLGIVPCSGAKGLVWAELIVKN